MMRGSARPAAAITPAIMGESNYTGPPPADERAWDMARRPQPCLLLRNARLRRVVARKLAQDWSPEQISGWLVQAFPSDKAMRVSAETIYRSLSCRPAGR
jgi:IS30 family transposase